MRSNLILRCASAVCVTTLFAFLCAAPSLHAQGGEPLACPAVEQMPAMRQHCSLTHGVSELRHSPHRAR